MTSLHAAVGMPPYHEWDGTPSCLGADPELFFVPKYGDVREALAVCAGCPVRAECLAFALRLPSSDDDGVWGGTTPGQRAGLRRRYGRVGRRDRW